MSGSCNVWFSRSKIWTQFPSMDSLKSAGKIVHKAAGIDMGEGLYKSTQLHQLCNALYCLVRKQYTK